MCFLINPALLISSQRIPSLAENPSDKEDPVGTSSAVNSAAWIGIELNEDFEKISQKRLKPTIIEKKVKEKSSEFWE